MIERHTLQNKNSVVELSVCLLVLACCTDWFGCMQVLEEMCQTCMQQGRQLKRVRMRFNLARLHQEAMGVFDEPNVTSCLVCDQRMKTLFQRLQQNAPRVCPAFLRFILFVLLYRVCWIVLQSAFNCTSVCFMSTFNVPLGSEFGVLAC